MLLSDYSEERGDGYELEFEITQVMHGAHCTLVVIKLLIQTNKRTHTHERRTTVINRYLGKFDDAATGSLRLI